MNIDEYYFYKLNNYRNNENGENIEINEDDSFY